ncbi:cytochrome P450 [Seiridium cupressi]
MDSTNRLGDRGSILHSPCDVLTRIAYGKEFGYLETDSDAHDYVSSADGPAVLRYTDSWLDSLLADRARVHRAEAHRQKRDWALLSDTGVPRDVLEGEVPFQIIAGSDTTATAIRGIMLNLMTIPYAYQTLQKEIDTTIFKDQISSPVGSQEGKQLEDPQAVIDEGLRPSTLFTGLIMKEVPPQGDTIHGHFVPGGTRIAQSFVAIERSKGLFGECSDPNAGSILIWTKNER